MPLPNAIDRLIEWAAPRWALRRAGARLRLSAARAYYDGASLGRRTASLRRSGADANTITRRTLPHLRQHHRDLVRNNPYAKRAVEAIVSNVGAATPHFVRNGSRADDLQELAKRHLETPECDSDGRLGYAGIQNLCIDAIVQGGDVLVRRRRRRPADGLAVPLQFQVLEPEFLDTSKDGPVRGGGQIIQGVEFDAIGRKRQYHLFLEHPGGVGLRTESRPVPARDIGHFFRVERPGQVRGIPWGAAVILRLADLHDYQDAQLMRQKIAACFAAFIEEPFETSPPSSVETDSDGKLIESMEPGIVERLPLGTTVKFSNPPTVENYHEYTSVELHAIAIGYGVSYETLTSDLSGVTFSSGKMGRLDMQRNIDRWQRDILVAQIGQTLTGWWLEAAGIIGAQVEGATVRHYAPSGDMIDPTREWKARRDAIRSGQRTLVEEIRSRGRDPREFLEEIRETQELLDEFGIVLDSDPRLRTAAGNEVGGGGGGGQPVALDDQALDAIAELLASRNGVYR